MSRTLIELRNENLKIAYIQDIKNFLKFTLAFNNVFKSYYGGIILNLYLIMKLGFDKTSKVIAEAYRADLITIAEFPVLLEKINDNIMNYINGVGIDYVILTLYSKKNLDYLNNIIKSLNVILSYNKYCRDLIKKSLLHVSALYVENASKKLISEIKKLGTIVINYGTEKSDINVEKMIF